MAIWIGNELGSYFSSSDVDNPSNGINRLQIGELAPKAAVSQGRISFFSSEGLSRSGVHLLRVLKHKGF